MLFIAFTICSNNYLSKACILGESLLRHNPATRFVIGLVDRKSPQIDYGSMRPFTILPVDEVEIPNFGEMLSRYARLELFTAVKPFYFRHLFRESAGEDNVVVSYLDPDIKVYGGFTTLCEAMETHNLMLTPHILTPIPIDGRWPAERGFLKYGLYNLGFCAIRANPEGCRAVDWWCDRLARDCRIDAGDGLFLDQLWMNLAPIFFKDVEICRHPGYNVAYWNLHERKLQCRDGIWYVNNHFPLVFYHFSQFQPEASEHIGRSTNTRFTRSDRPEMAALLDEYHEDLLRHNARLPKSVPWAYSAPENQAERSGRFVGICKSLVRRVVRSLKRVIPRSFREFIRAA
jgi:hypothetical protein